MKKQFHSFWLISLTFIILSFFSIQKTQACVDYHPAPYSTVIYDSSLFYVEITVHNLHLFGGGAGDFCTCAFSSYSDLLTDVYYVAFIDSATGLPVNGFDPWQADAGSTAGWSLIMPGTDWEGFVAAVNSAGLQAGKAVNLVMRGNLPAGYDFAALDSAIFNTSLGTDKADSLTHAPMNAHQSVSSLGAITYQEVGEGYFTGATPAAALQVKVFPNPALSQIIIQCDGVILNSLDVVNSLGEGVFSKENINAANYILSMENLRPGTYHLRLQTPKGILQTTVVVQ